MTTIQQASLELLLERSELLDDAWEEEISRRVAAIDCGRGTLVRWDEARKRMFSNAQENT